MFKALKKKILDFRISLLEKKIKYLTREQEACASLRYRYYLLANFKNSNGHTYLADLEEASAQLNYINEQLRRSRCKLIDLRSLV